MTKSGNTTDDVVRIALPAGIVLAAISLAYVFLEIRWGLALIRLTANPDATREAVDAMVREGRLLAAFGIVFSIWKGLLVGGRHHWVLRYATFGTFITVLYFSIGKFYESVIDAIPAKESLSIYQLAAYRTGLLKGEILDDDLAPLKDDPLAITAWPMITLDDKYRVPARVMYERKRKLLHDELHAAARDNAVADYQKNADDLERLRVAMRDSRKIGQAFSDGYQKLKRAPWPVTRCGVKFNRHMSKAVYANTLVASNCPDYLQAGRWFLDGTASKVAAAAKKAGPYAGKSRGEILAMVEGKVGNEVAARIDSYMPALWNIKADQKSRDVIASMIVPVLAICLSILSILTNLGSVVITLATHYLGNAWMKAAWMQSTAPAIFAAIVLGLTPPQAFDYEPMRHLENLMHESLPASLLISRLASIERIFL